MTLLELIGLRTQKLEKHYSSYVYVKHVYAILTANIHTYTYNLLLIIDYTYAT